VLHRPIETTAETGQVESSQKRVSGNATVQETFLTAPNSAATLLASLLYQFCQWRMLCATQTSNSR
jgi:hypothetical protein